MRNDLNFYIGGAWVDPAGRTTLDVIDPAAETVSGRIALGTAADVDRAVKAARKSFASFSRSSREDRLALLARILAEYERRHDDVARAITEEMGAPAALARGAQAAMGRAHLKTAIAILKDYAFAELEGTTRIVKEPIGVCAFITPWNWPMNQIACKVAPALATGCTMVLKPSEIAPYSARVFAEIMHEAGTPPGVFNLVNGTGAEVGAAMSGHTDVDMVSFTGSTRAGIEVARNAAPTVKRVTQELGGKSPNLILEDADFASAVTSGVDDAMQNSGQSCNAPTRMIVPQGRMDEAIGIARKAAEAHTVGDPNGNFSLGPVVSAAQWNKVQGLIEAGIEDGATLVTGGLGRPEGLSKGYYVKPTVFAHVREDMRIAREEIFGPVLSIMGYDGFEDAIRLANATDYGLAAHIWGTDEAKLNEAASRIRAGQIVLNGARLDLMAPFGGYKRSGNGREWGRHGFTEFLELKAIMGAKAAEA